MDEKTARPRSTPTTEDRREITAAVIRPSRLFVLFLTLAFAGGLRVPETLQYAPFAASLVLFGLPHGALDHLVPSRLAGRRPDARSVLGIVLLYAVLSGLLLALWFVAPVVAFVSFILLTAFHWGAGDLHALLFFGPPGLGRTGGLTRALFVAGRGCIPMLVPLVFFPGAYRGLAADVAGLFGGGVGGLSPLFEPGVRGGLLAGLAAILALAWVLALRDLGREWRLLLPVVGETALLCVFFAVVPPVLAVGVYFTAWHAPRHIARLILLHPPSYRGSWPRALARFGRDAAPLTALALVALTGLYFAVPTGAGRAGSLLAVYLVLVSALTLPHAAVVSYMDWRQGVWGAGRRSAQVYPVATGGKTKDQKSPELPHPGGK